MAYTRMTAAEAAALIKNGDHIAMSGFTPAGVAKATTKELAKIAVAEHEAGREFKVAIFTGASTGQSTDGDLANAQAILYRAPYTTNPDFRKHVNLGEIPYNDLHLSHMAQELRYGFYGDVDWAILEVCDIEEVGNDYHVFLTAAGGISPTAARLAKHVILELNSFHNPNAKHIHDVYEPLDPPYRKAIPIEHVSDRIGVPYVSIPKEKVVCVVECNIPDEARAFKDSDPVTDKIGYREANIKDWHLAHTVIKSNRRFAYEEVQEILEKNGVKDGTGEPAPARKSYEGEYAKELITLDALAKELRKKRFKNGSVKFDREELHFDVDENGKPTRAYFKKSKDANKLIEEFMLLANRQVAESIGKVKKGEKAKTLPYRIHDQPDPTKLERLREFITHFGYKVKTTGSKEDISKSLNKLMDDVNGKREQNVIESVALRAMMKAKYSVFNIGHYGLAFDYYTHFTSPIRRYPDTMVHRLLTRYQEGGRSANRDHYEELCEHSSDMEQIAQNAERDSIKYKMVEFMSEYIGEEFDAHISGITAFGIYAEIDENHCEGMIPLHDLDDDYYDFDERNYQLVGRRRHNKYMLGDPIRIKVAKANIEKRQLDFTIVD